MADIEKGFTYSGSSPNNTVTAANLNTHVDGATILPAFISAKPEVTSLATDDYIVVYQSSTGLLKKISKANSITAAVNITGARNTVMQNNAATPNTKIDVTCSEVLMRSDAGNSFRATGINDTLDISVYAGASTADGRDFTPLTGTPGFYGIWAISNGVLIKLLFSVASTPLGSPTLPAGYLYKCLLGVVYMNTSGVLMRFSQRGNEVAITHGSPANTAAATLNPKIGATEFTGIAVNVTANTFSTIDLSLCVPILAAKVRGIFGSTTDLGSTGFNVMLAVASKGTGLLTGVPTDLVGLQLFNVPTRAAAVQEFFCAATFEVEMLTAATISAACSTVQTALSMRVTGYTLNL